MTDSQGQQVPLAYVKPYDRQRDRIARRCKARWEKVRAIIENTYMETALDLDLIEAMAADGRTDRKLGKKGNFQFTSFDGLIQVARCARYELRFDERLRTAQEIIEAIIAEKAEGADADLAELVKGIFRPTSDGLLSQARVMGLFRLKIKHPRWAEAMDLIRESIESRRGKTILSVRTKASRETDWSALLLDISSCSLDASANAP
jgi:hypothetical protein